MWDPPLVKRVSAACFVLFALAPCQLATAQVRPLSVRDAGGSAPALAGDRVAWSRAAGERGVRVFSAPPAGGPVRSSGVARIDRGQIERWTLDGAPGRLALRVSTPAEYLFAGPDGGPLGLSGSTPLLAESAFPERDVWAGAESTVTLEEDPPRNGLVRLVVRSPGAPTRYIPLPDALNADQIDVSGTVAAVGYERGRARGVDLVDLRSGHTIRSVDGGVLDSISYVGLGDDGSVAVTGRSKRGRDVAAYAVPGAARLRTVALGLFDEVDPGTAGVALAVRIAGAGATLDGSSRVVVVRPGGDPRRPAVTFRGPPATDVDGLSFDGTRVVWGTDGCQVLAEARGGTRLLPRGVCVRSEVATGLYSLTRRAGRTGLSVPLRCLTGVGAVCRVRVTAVDRKSRPVASRTARIRAGRRSIVRLVLRGRTARRPGKVTVRVRIRDPGGRGRTAFAG